MIKRRAFAKRQTGEVVIKPRRSPRVRLLIAVAVVVGVLVGGFAIYNHGLSMAGFNRLLALRQNQALHEEIERLKNENQELREGLARTQRTLQMDQTAYQEIDQSLKASEQEIIKLREELAFYRNIISPDNKVAGLQIQSFNVEPSGGPNEYYYKLVLIQALKHDRMVSGRVRFEIAGTQNGESMVEQRPRPIDKAIGVNFKYFQDVQGSLQFPQDFKPLRVKVSVQTGGQAVERTFPWPQLQTAISTGP